MIVRPDVPIAQDTGRLAGRALELVVAGTLWLMNTADPRFTALPILRIVQTVGLYAMLALALVLVLAVARLVWKVDYLRGMHDDDHDGP
jgi:hypothetical protein